MIVAGIRFQVTSRIAEKRTERLVILFTESEKKWIEIEAKRRGTTAQNLVRMALAAIASAK